MSIKLIQIRILIKIVLIWIKIMIIIKKASLFKDFNFSYDHLKGNKLCVASLLTEINIKN